MFARARVHACVRHCIPTSVCVCVCVCVWEGGERERQTEKERESVCARAHTCARFLKFVTVKLILPLSSSYRGLSGSCIEEKILSFEAFDLSGTGKLLNVTHFCVAKNDIGLGFFFHSTQDQ